MSRLRGCGWRTYVFAVWNFANCIGSMAWYTRRNLIRRAPAAPTEHRWPCARDWLLAHGDGASSQFGLVQIDPLIAASVRPRGPARPAACARVQAGLQRPRGQDEAAEKRDRRSAASIEHASRAIDARGTTSDMRGQASCTNSRRQYRDKAVVYQRVEKNF